MAAVNNVAISVAVHPLKLSAIHIGVASLDATVQPIRHRQSGHRAFGFVAPSPSSLLPLVTSERATNADVHTAQNSCPHGPRGHSGRPSSLMHTQHVKPKTSSSSLIRALVAESVG
jgi:hypothetical protein